MRCTDHNRRVYDFIRLDQMDTAIKHTVRWQVHEPQINIIQYKNVTYTRYFPINDPMNIRAIVAWHSSRAREHCEKSASKSYHQRDYVRNYAQFKA